MNAARYGARGPGHSHRSEKDGSAPNAAALAKYHEALQTGLWLGARIVNKLAESDSWAQTAEISPDDSRELPVIKPVS